MRLFPFVLPWDDSSPSATALSLWFPKPAGGFGHIRVGPDGHLYAGTKRMQFFGVNLAFGACLPDKRDAEKIAARMAKFGINIVRFHEMDMDPFPDGLGTRNGPSTCDFDSEALDRLDYFIAQLKRNGIYVNLNLLVGRQFSSADGLPVEIEQLKWKERHVVGFFYEPILNLELDYARKLLTHYNPYTGMTYTEDPALAFVEINNENGLIYAWLEGTLDHLPQVFLQNLQQQWNEWLKKRYGTTEALRQAWKQTSLGEELLVNTDFGNGLEPWILECHEDAKASAAITDSVPSSVVARKSVGITVTQPGSQNWYVQLNQPGVKVQANQQYILSFYAKADKPCRIRASIMQAHSPWEGLGFETLVQLTTDWQQFRFATILNEGDNDSRVNFGDLALQAGSYWFTSISLRPGGAIGLGTGGRLEDSSIPPFTQSRFQGSVEEAKRDWLRFLWETEDHYWQTLLLYLRNDLKLEAQVIGTDDKYSTPNIMSKLDCVDTHAYWQHPTFPNGLWDPNSWYVPNLTMVNETGGMLPWIAVRRVLGKPYSVSEYNHPAPNTYATEGYLLLAAYAAFQDWDCIYAYRYSGRTDNWDLRRLSDWFDVDQHPTKMVSMIPAVAMFVRGDVKPGQKEIVVKADEEREVDLLRFGQASRLVDAELLGVPRQAALLHRISIATEGCSVPATALSPKEVNVAVNRLVSDTGELVWDLSNQGAGVVTVNTSKSKAVIGYGGTERFDLGGFVFEPGQTMQNGWCSIALTALEGELSPPVNHPIHLLITATGYLENANMGWNQEKSTVGADWGTSPSMVEGIAARIILPLSSERVQAWALDECGQRKAQIPVERDANGNAVMVIGPQWQTLWYEVASTNSMSTITSTIGTSVTTSSTSTSHVSTNSTTVVTSSSSSTSYPTTSTSVLTSQFSTTSTTATRRLRHIKRLRLDPRHLLRRHL
jgi:hypothetical protein